MIPRVNIYCGLWYYPDINRFTDETGVVINDIFRLFEPWQIRNWIEHCRGLSGECINYQRVMDKHGRWVDLYYMEPDADHEHLDYLREHNRCYPRE